MAEQRKDLKINKQPKTKLNDLTVAQVPIHKQRLDIGSEWVDISLRDNIQNDAKVKKAVTKHTKKQQKLINRALNPPAHHDPIPPSWWQANVVNSKFGIAIANTINHKYAGYYSTVGSIIFTSLSGMSYLLFPTLRYFFDNSKNASQLSVETVQNLTTVALTNITQAFENSNFINNNSINIPIALFNYLFKNSINDLLAEANQELKGQANTSTTFDNATYIAQTVLVGLAIFNIALMNYTNLKRTTIEKKENEIKGISTDFFDRIESAQEELVTKLDVINTIPVANQI